MLSDFKIGIDNFFFGVGITLRDAYLTDYLKLNSLNNNNKEIKMWLEKQKNNGILSFTYPKLGEYTSRFAETGSIGLILFLIPPFILLHKLYLKITDGMLSINDKLPYVFFIISLIGIVVSGIGDSINITYCYWILLGLGYAMCFGKNNTKSDVKTNDE